ncbi:MAG: hypothetical protein JO275_03025, partial [Verrucomicrobia bacterium]|nr:hypothetical protein [Verrucomicrobiota bacterium]
MRSTEKELPVAKRQRKNGSGRSGDEQKGAIRREGALQSVVELVAESRQFARRFKKRAPSTSSGQAWFEQVCEPAQAFVAACAVRHFASRNCWLICPDARRQEEVFNGLLNWGITAWFFPELEAPAIEGAVPDPEVVAERLNV